MNMDGIIDFHTHILPGIDDGAKTPEQSIEMLRALKKQGVASVVLTPHFYTHNIRMEDFLKGRSQSYDQLCACGGDGILPLRLGAETYLTDFIFNYEDITPLCISGTRYLLTEMSFHSRFGSSAFHRLERLIGNYSVTPILAHVERYEPIMHDWGVADGLLDLGCIMQVNVSSFATKSRATLKRLLRMVDQGYIHLLGTDCHNMDTRNPDMLTGLRVLEKKLGADCIKTFLEYGTQVFEE